MLIVKLWMDVSLLSPCWLSGHLLSQWLQVDTKMKQMASRTRMYAGTTTQKNRAFQVNAWPTQLQNLLSGKRAWLLLLATEKKFSE